MQGKRKGAKTAAKASKAKSKAAGAKEKGSAGRTGRLRPGELDGLVLGYMKKHKTELPLSPTAVAHGIERSSGAVGNCLGRLEKEKKVHLADKKPRRYGLAGSKK